MKLVKSVEALHGNTGTIGEGENSMTFTYDALTVDEQSRFISEAMMEHNSPHHVDYPGVAKLKVTSLSGLVSPAGEPVTSIKELMAQNDSVGTGYLLMSMGITIWNAANGINRKKS